MVGLEGRAQARLERQAAGGRGVQSKVERAEEVEERRRGGREGRRDGGRDAAGEDDGVSQCPGPAWFGGGCRLMLWMQPPAQ